MPHESRHLFGRELEIIGRCARRILGPLRPRRAPPPARAAPYKASPERSKAKGRPRIGRRVPRGLGFITVALSILLHVGIGLLLLTRYLDLADESASKRPGERPELSIQLRILRAPQKAPPAAPEPVLRPRPIPSPPEAPTETPLPEPSPRAEPEIASASETPSDTQTAQSAEDAAPIASSVQVPPLGHAGHSSRSAAARGSSAGLYPTRGEGKLQALGRHGGDGHTENAVTRGLRWLSEHQNADGTWSASDFQRHCRGHTACPGRGLDDFDIGVSALATLAFLGAGHSPDEAGPYRRHLRKALAAIVRQQNGRGVYGQKGDKYGYNHAIATLAIAEALGASPASSDSLRDSLTSALRRTWASQQPGGGWDYSTARSGRDDLSVTGWQVLALRASQGIGFATPPAVTQRLRHLLGRAFTEDGYGIYANLDPDAGRRGPNMAAVGLLSHLYLDGLPQDRRARLARRRILRDHPPELRRLGKWPESFQSYYYWYCATLALFHIGGEDWDAWNTLLKRVLLPLQSHAPHRDGSWDPEPSWIGASGGRVYSTAINVLTLEVYYRYQPLFSTRRY